MRKLITMMLALLSTTAVADVKNAWVGVNGAT